jgi:hypothetical protein
MIRGAQEHVAGPGGFALGHKAMFRSARILVPCILAAGCATGGEFPSLAPRPVEQLAFEEPIKVDPPVAADPALRGRAAALLADARAGDGAFEEAYAQALPLVQGAGAVGSDSWLIAQEAISRAEAATVGTTRSLVDLDLLLAEQSDDPTNAAVWVELRTAKEAMERLAADQRRRLGGLKASVALP